MSQNEEKTNHSLKRLNSQSHMGRMASLKKKLAHSAQTNQTNKGQAKFTLGNCKLHENIYFTEIYI